MKIDWDLVSWVKGAPTRTAIMRLLATKPRTKPDIARILKIKWHWAHHALEPLCEHGLVVCLSSSKVQRAKIYGLTAIGKRVATYL